MSNGRTCVFSCGNARTFFSLPKEEGPKRRLWLDFLGPVALESGQVLFVCDRHFRDDYLINLGLYQSGLTQRLILKSGAIPTIKPTGESGTVSAAEVSTQASIRWEHSVNQPSAAPLSDSRVKSRGVQTLPMILLGRTVSTQVHKAHMSTRDRKVQTLVLAKTVSTQINDRNLIPRCSRGVQCMWPDVKLARWEGEEEEEEDEDEVDVDEEELETEDNEEPDFSEVSFEDLTHHPELRDLDPADLRDSKYLVFESCLRNLFDVCPACFHPCVVQKKKSFGGFVSFSQACPHCPYTRQWQSQPIVRSVPAGDLQLSAAVWFNQADFSTIRRICKCMNLQIHRYQRFRSHCRTFLEPSVVHKWKADQKRLEKKKKRNARACENRTTKSKESSRKIQMFSKSRKRVKKMKCLTSSKLLPLISSCSYSAPEEEEMSPSSSTDSAPEKEEMLSSSSSSSSDSGPEEEETPSSSSSVDCAPEEEETPSSAPALQSLQRVVQTFMKKRVCREDSRICRLYLASMHHKENTKREASKRKKLIKKKPRPTYDYVWKLMQLVFSEVLLDPQKFMKEMKTTAMTEPV